MHQRIVMKETPQLTTNLIYVKVALFAPIRKYFDYSVIVESDCFPPGIQPGVRVEVPFGKRTLIGFIVAIVNTTNVPLQQLKAITKIIDKEPLFPAVLQELLFWASQYYQTPLGMVYEAALTATLRKGKIIEDDIKKVSASQNDPPISEYGYFHEKQISLNSAQQIAINTITESLDKFQTFLLDGVTGSGKTEVYIQVIAKVLQQKKQVLILVPEINLTPQTLKQFSQRFAVPVLAFHSQVSDKQRTTIWLQAKLGLPSIIIGTRSATFLPLTNPGLFILDEEHDQSFKQQEGFRYSARDLLIKRAQLENCPIVLGSATPALETLWNAKLKRYIHLQLPERAGLASQPSIEILDIRHKKLKQGLSLPLLHQIDQHLKNNGQVLLFLNRRGYAPVLMCNNCNFVLGCKCCDARMILHFHPQPKLICHHCQTINSIPHNCPACNSKNLVPIGLGTEKLEHILQAKFPAAKIIRVDRDATRKKHAMHDIIEQIIAGKANILIGTQMLAKGHHFPNLSLVVILDIDGALFSSDFRTLERMGQLITQVAGRAGRAELPGHVILQTQHPDHPLLTTLLYQGYHALSDILLEERKQSMLPPFGYQILFKAASKNPTNAIKFLTWVKEQTIYTNQVVKVLGPIPAPIEKKASYFRAQLLLQSNNRKHLHKASELIIAKIDEYKNLRKIRWSVDVDPLDFY